MKHKQPVSLAGQLQSIIDKHSLTITDREMALFDLKQQMLALDVTNVIARVQLNSRIIKLKKQIQIMSIEQRLRKSALSVVLDKRKVYQFDDYHPNHHEILKLDLKRAKRSRTNVVHLDAKTMPQLQSEIKRTSRAINYASVKLNTNESRLFVKPLVDHIKMLKKHINVVIAKQR